MPETEKIIAVSAALGSAASWALGAVLFKRISESMSPFAMTMAKGFMSMVLLGVSMCFVGFTPMDRHALMLLVLSGVVGIALGDSLFFKALGDLGPVSMLVLMVAGQVLTILLALVFLKEMPSPGEWAGMAFIIAGVVTALSVDLRGNSRPSGLRGICYGVAAMVCMAVSIIIAKGPLEQLPSLQATFIRLGAGSVLVFGLGMMSGKVSAWMQPLHDGKFLARFVLAVAVVTFGGFWLSMYAIKHLDVALANTLNSTEPIFVIPIAFFLLKEKIRIASIIGATLVIIGLAFVF
jgi:drug/metabolite transporter (DMT)-like permease